MSSENVASWWRLRAQRSFDKSWRACTTSTRGHLYVHLVDLVGCARGIAHRDLKPENVLVLDRSWEDPEGKAPQALGRE